MTTTRSTDTPVTGTRAEAERIARLFSRDENGFIVCDPAALIDEVRAGLQARDERAARICEAGANARQPRWRYPCGRSRT